MRLVNDVERESQSSGRSVGCRWSKGGRANDNSLVINETDAFPAAGGTTGSSLREAAEVNFEKFGQAPRVMRYGRT